MRDETRIAVLGAGSWGTVLASLTCANGCNVTLWDRDELQAAAIAADRENRRYLPGHILPQKLAVTCDLEQALKSADVIIFAVPSGAVSDVSNAAAAFMKPSHKVLSASKGLDCATGKRVTEIIRENCPQGTAVAALSGPNLAVEIAAGVPTASVVACACHESAELCRDSVAGPTFRIYTNSDIIGVELGGALKNVLAIGAGICEGMGFGDNTKAALLTRGLAEITRLGEALGAKRETFAGLSGVGDLMATSFSHLSRNLRVGLALGQGASLQETLERIGQVAEGVPTTKAAVALADSTGVEMPIAREIHAVLFENRPAKDGLRNLMARQWKDEV